MGNPILLHRFNNSFELLGTDPLVPFLPCATLAMIPPLSAKKSCSVPRRYTFIVLKLRAYHRSSSQDVPPVILIGEDSKTATIHTRNDHYEKANTADNAPELAPSSDEIDGS